MEVTASDEELATEMVVQIPEPPYRLSKNDAHGTTDGHPRRGHPKTVRMTDNSRRALGLQYYRSCVLFYVAPPVVVHFNYMYIKFSTEYLQ